MLEKKSHERKSVWTHDGNIVGLAKLKARILVAVTSLQDKVKVLKKQEVNI